MCKIRCTSTLAQTFYFILPEKLIQTKYFRYGQEEEDRQWDSGGDRGGGGDYYYGDYYNDTGHSGQIRDQYENRINSHRTNRDSSNKDMSQYQSQSQDDEQEVSDFNKVYF